MQKDELIQLHTFLLQLKTHLEDMVENDGSKGFISYEKLDITPYQVYKSKREHKLAVFTLSKGIADLLTNNDCPGLNKISSSDKTYASYLYSENNVQLIKGEETLFTDSEYVVVTGIGDKKYIPPYFLEFTASELEAKMGCSKYVTEV